MGENSHYQIFTFFDLIIPCTKGSHLIEMYQVVYASCTTIKKKNPFVDIARTFQLLIKMLSVTTMSLHVSCLGQ